jgi:HD domain
MPEELEVRAWMRIVGRWRPVDCSRGRTTTAVALNVGLALLALIGFAILQPSSDWGDPVMIVALAAVSAIAYLAEARLKAASMAFFGASLIVALVALAVAGPLPALLVWLVPDLISRYILRREPRFSPGLVATLSSYALAALAGAELLRLAGSPEGAAIAPSLYAVGVAMWAINFAVARLAFAPFYQGYRVAPLLRDEFFDLAPAVLGMLTVGVGAAMGVEAIGVPALAVLALVIVAPQIALERIAESQSAARLARADAMRLYTAAITDVMDLPRSQRRELACAVELVHAADDPITTRGLDWREADVSRVAFLALHTHERWAGDGWPAGLPAEAIPRGSRILAVADAWAGLTASGTQEMAQPEAILALAAQSGLAFDPEVVDAATRVVGDEEGFAREPGFQPKLHRLPVPRSMRRNALPAMLPRLLGS